MNQRVNPLTVSDENLHEFSSSGPLSDLSDFQARSPRPTVHPSEIDAVAIATGFPSRAPHKKGRNYTGRNRQFNTRLTNEYFNVIYAFADRKNVALAEVLEQALDLLIEKEGNPLA